jgi:N-formylmaleamate deformylase
MKILFCFLVFTSGLLAQAPFQVKVSGHGQPMILIPGLSSSGETWDTTVAHYSDRYECHALTVAGFAGVPRVPAPMLARVRDGLADYIKKQKLVHPVIVGHSLGGFLALDLASRYPQLPGKLVIVDSYPFLGDAMQAGATPEMAKALAARLHDAISQQTREMYESTVKSGVFIRPLVTSDADFAKLVRWGLASDRTAVADAMAEVLATDLREPIASIPCPTLVLGSWIAEKDFTTHERTEAKLRAEYAKLHGAQIAVTDTARHFIMLDDPSWFFAQLDAFLSASAKNAKK